MGNYLNGGNSGFASVRKGIYVDKTQMIAFINSTLGTADKLTCVSRPRRFGKSFAAKMLCAYYDKSCDSRQLFEGLAISRDPSFEKHLNRYNVICFDVTWFISSVDEIEDTVRSLQERIISELREACPSAREADTLPETLAEIYKITNEKFIFIIDEWDALFREAKEHKRLQEEYINLLRGLFKNTGFTDKVIEAAYMTGILPIKKYGSQSAVSDFQEYTMLSPEPLEQYVGFTESEVKDLCETYGADFYEMKRWYDGYSADARESVYNPNSVTQAIKKRRFGSYWTRTETYEALKIYIDLDMDGLKEAVIRMLGGEKIRIMTGSFQNDMTNIECKDDVLTLMVHLGYLAYDAAEEAVFIPNEEVRQEFVLAVTKGRHKELAKLIQNSDQLLLQTLNGNEAAVERVIEEAHKVVSSPLSYNKEDSLRSTIRFAYLACLDEFIEIDEMPSGTGFADMVFMPKKGSAKPIILIELKWNKTSESAMRQIKERDYPHAFKNYGGDIYLVGITYDADSKKHTCKIEKYSM